MLVQLLLEPRPGGTRLDPRRLRDRVHVEHPVHAAEVDADRAAVAIAEARLDPADHARPAAEGDRRGVLVGAVVEHQVDVLGGLRERDQVGRVRELSPEAADDVPVRLALRVGDPVVAVV